MNKRDALSGDNNTQWTAHFPVPPVCTDCWTITDWIVWVDQRGKWVNKKKFPRLFKLVDGYKPNLYHHL